MTAQCVECATLYTWHAYRGSKLADLRCKCGSPLEISASSYEGGEMLFRGRKSGQIGHWPNA